MKFIMSLFIWILLVHVPMWGMSEYPTTFNNKNIEPATVRTLQSFSADTKLLMQGLCSLASTNPCVSEARCEVTVPIIGEVICVCPQGYGGDGKRGDLGGNGCINIDECASGLHNCNLINQDCIDTPGSFECVCKSGYKLAPNMKTCLDIDECQNPNLNNCDPETTVCRNLEGSYQCDCLDPTEIVDAVSGKCRAINYCQDMNGVLNPCQHLCHYLKAEESSNRSIDPDYSTIRCTCYSGYELGPDLHQCIDIDECQTKQHTCDPAGKISKCVNTVGSYRCECNEMLGYTTGPDGKTCVNLDECAVDPYICGGPDTCCKDLPPPQRFACMMPVGSLLNSSTTGGVPQALSSSLLGFGSGSPHETAMLSVDSLHGPIHQISSNCFEHNVSYVTYVKMEENNPKSDIYVEEDVIIKNNIESAALCQMNCQIDFSCDFFSYDVAKKNCYLAHSMENTHQQIGMISGPKYCPKETTSNNNLLTQIASRTILNPDPTRAFGRILNEQKSESEYDYLDGQALLENNNYNTSDNYLVSEGEQEEIEFEKDFDSEEIELIYNSNFDINSDINDQSKLNTSNEEVTLEVFLDNELCNGIDFICFTGDRIPDLRKLKQMNRVGAITSLRAKNPAYFSNHSTTSAVKNYFKNILKATEDTTYSTENIKQAKESMKEPFQKYKSKSRKPCRERNLQGNFLKLSGITGGRGMQCPAGYVLGYTLQKIKRRKATIENVQKLPQNGKAYDGSTQQITPEAVTNALIKNVNYASAQAHKWFGEASSIPQSIAQAAMSPSHSGSGGGTPDHIVLNDISEEQQTYHQSNGIAINQGPGPITKPIFAKSSNHSSTVVEPHILDPSKLDINDQIERIIPSQIKNVFPPNNWVNFHEEIPIPKPQYSMNGSNAGAPSGMQMTKNALNSPLFKTLGIAGATGVVVGLAQKKMFSGGPGQSKFLDRSGKSKSIAYGTRKHV